VSNLELLSQLAEKYHDRAFLMTALRQSEDAILPYFSA